MSCCPTWISTLCRRNSPFRFFPFGVLLPWRVRQHVCLQSAGLLLGLGWRSLCYVTWVFSHVPCSSSGPAACAAFSAAGYLGVGVFPVTGCLSFSFPGGVGWASALPFFFWASPAPLACWGRWGFAPCVRVLQLRWCLLGLQVRSPCCPSFTLG